MAECNEAGVSRRGFAKFLMTSGVVLLMPAGASAPPAYGDENRSLRDSAGREVSFPSRISRVTPSGPFAMSVLMALCPERIATNSGGIAGSEGRFVGERVSAAEALKQLVRDDAALEFMDSVLSAGSSGAFEVAQAAATLGQMKLAAVCLVAGFVLSVSAPEPAIELIDEIEANMNSYTAGLRAYRYLDLSLTPRYEFESWNGQTAMYGVSRAVGGWSAVPSVQP